jgi:hypothetical protein
MTAARLHLAGVAPHLRLGNCHIPEHAVECSASQAVHFQAQDRHVGFQAASWAARNGPSLILADLSSWLVLPLSTTTTITTPMIHHDMEHHSGIMGGLLRNPQRQQCAKPLGLGLRAPRDSAPESLPSVSGPVRTTCAALRWARESLPFHRGERILCTPAQPDPINKHAIAVLRRSIFVSAF